MFLTLRSGAFVDCSGDLPLIDSITIEDIAYSLAAQTRFLGHQSRALTVLQHSLKVAVMMTYYRPETILQGLLHDASEALTGDIPGPLKAIMGPRIKLIERSIQHQILDLLEVPRPNDRARSLIKQFDLLAIMDEVYDAGLLQQGPHCREWSAWFEQTKKKIKENILVKRTGVPPNDPLVFMNLFYALKGNLK